MRSTAQSVGHAGGKIKYDIKHRKLESIKMMHMSFCLHALVLDDVALITAQVIVW